MKYYLFLDESGNHDLKNIDQNFPIFLLCGILISEEEYFKLNEKIDNLKNKFWNNSNIILHSRDIRKRDNNFQILFDLKVKENFYNEINEIIKSTNYIIISSCIDKQDFIKKYGKLENDVYEVSLSFIIERMIFCLDEKKDADNIKLVIEKRGKNEDQKLSRHIERLRKIGTYYVKPERFEKYNFSFTFKSKSENINGLQVSDLIAYPLARYCINPKNVNLPFELFRNKIYQKNGKIYGLKIFP